MADTPKPNPSTEDDMHWGIAYLREDIQELRLGQRSMQDRMDTMNRDLAARMDSRFAVMLTAMIALIGISIGANFTFLRMYLPAQ